MTVTDEPAGPDANARFRRRLLDGLAASIADQGYRSTTITDIVAHAQTSKRTFYREFADKHECFIELLHAANDDMVAQTRAAVNPEAPWRIQIQQGVAAYIARIEATPAITLSWIRDLPTLGTAGQVVQRQAMNQMTEMMIEVTQGPGFQREAVPPATHRLATLLLGGVRELTALALEDGRDVRDISDTVVTATISLLSSGGNKNRS